MIISLKKMLAGQSLPSRKTRISGDWKNILFKLFALVAIISTVPAPMRAMCNHAGTGKQSSAKEVIVVTVDTSRTPEIMLDPEKSRDWSWKALGARDASPEMQERFERVLAEYKKQGWRLPEKIWLKFNKYSKGNLHGTITDSIDTIWTSNEHNGFSDEECEHVFAHESAHIALRNHKWLNPHWYMDKYVNSTNGYKNSLLTAAGFAITYHALAKKPSRLSNIMGVLGLGGYFIGAQYCDVTARPSASRVTEQNGIRVLGREYPCVKKLEEIECDLIAVFIMPEGGKHGVSYMVKCLENGDDEESDTHPCDSTRLKILQGAQWIQENIIQKKA